MGLGSVTPVYMSRLDNDCHFTRATLVTALDMYAWSMRRLQMSELDYGNNCSPAGTTCETSTSGR